MKKVLLAGTVILFSVQSLFALTAREIMQKSDKLPQPRTVRSTALMTIMKRGESVTRTIKIKGIKLGGNQKVLARIVKPFKMEVLTHTRKGRDDQQWLKQSNGKVKKIISGDRQKPFVNSHIFYEDLKSRNINDSTYTLIGNETVEGHACYRIQAMPKPGKSIYNKAIFYVVKSGNLAYFVIRADIFYKGYLYKRLINYNVKKISGIITPMKAVMYRLNKQGKNLGKTIMEIKKIKYNSQKITESMFSKSRL